MAAVATERMVILVTPVQKKRIEAKARRLKVSTAELFRRSATTYEPEVESGEVEKMLELLIATHEKTLATLAGAERELAATRAHFAERRAAGAP